MTDICENAQYFLESTRSVLADMFGIESEVVRPVRECASIQTAHRFVISIFYTGTVFGEYILALPEETALRILGIEPDDPSGGREQARAEICDAFSEALNMIVGDSITELHKTFSKLTFTAPRILFGEPRYPQVKTAYGVIGCEHGEIECHFYLDGMRLDLATSYEEALASLLEVNKKLKEANRSLQEQQAQLVHSEKMASVGMLAAGVAHEINNPLMYVDANFTTLVDYLEVIQTMFALYDSLANSITNFDDAMRGPFDQLRELDEQEDISYVMEDTRVLLSQTHEGIERIKSIVIGLKEFSHADSSGYARADLNDVIENTLQLVWNQVKYHCEVVKELCPAAEVMCNKGEVGQVLVNLIMNAAQAIPEKGLIRLTSEKREDEVVVSVADNGVGMAPEQLKKIFNPFYTTKPVGKGTGLGLSISYGIMQRHGGSIEVESAPGKGTRFSLHFPKDAPASAEAAFTGLDSAIG